MRQRLDLGTALQALGAVLVLIALFLRWYDPGGSAWRVFEIVDLLLAALAVGALAVTARRLAGGDEGTPGWVQAISLAVLVIVAYELIDKPPAARDSALQTGAWLALGGAVVMAIGALLHRARIGIIIDVRERDRRRRVSAVDRRAGEAADAGGRPPRRPARRPFDADAEDEGPSRRDVVAQDPERTQPIRPLEDDERLT
jgi:hypothetical protein